MYKIATMCNIFVSRYVIFSIKRRRFFPDNQEKLTGEQGGHISLGSNSLCLRLYVKTRMRKMNDVCARSSTRTTTPTHHIRLSLSQTHTHTHTRKHTHARARTHTHTHTYVFSISLSRVHTHTHPSIHPSLPLFAFSVNRSRNFLQSLTSPLLSPSQPPTPTPLPPSSLSPPLPLSLLLYLHLRKIIQTPQIPSAGRGVTQAAPH